MRYLWLIALLLIAGCNNEIYVRDGVTDGDTFYLAPVASVDTDPVLQSWVAYSLVKSVCQLELGGENPARQSSYDCEFRARNVLVDAWAEQRAEDPDVRDSYLDELLAIREAGYLGEYTAYFFRRNNWQVPDEVDADAFDDWRRQHLRRHRPQTRTIGYWGYRDKSAQRLPETY
ncbi:MAG: hypothetical protein OEM85_18240 [Gammaproteobacteria bacterium]|nr:hypothetical protein [Gammaproteobacteria bacterium]MDH3375302.1 hypothetical protein [Gammaproteobacteria bacterium]MDH3409488.1 hypothetical protein [Gammaproteobacteria bacterium]